MTIPPSPNGPPRGERDAGGRFVRGNAGGPGNPHAKHVGALRAALLEAVTPEDFKAIAAALVSAAKRGEAWAVRELFDRTLGKPVEADFLARLEALEEGMEREGAA